MDLISVIVPVYKVEQYFTRCVNSILTQTYQNLEIILVDDGSPDRCPQMCEEIQRTDSRIKVIHKENGGLGYARNSGLDVATGEYVTFIDSDDWISTDHIENLYRAAVEAHADAVVGAHTSVSAEGTEVPHRVELEPKVYEGSMILDEILLPLIGADVDAPGDVQLNSSSCMILYRMQIIREHKLRFVSEKIAVAEDLYFNIDFFHYANRISAIQETGYYYFENQASISRKYHPKRFERTLNYYSTLQQRIAVYGLEDRVACRAQRSFLMKIRVAIRHIVFSDLKRKQKFQEIKNILNHDITKKVLNSYPINTFVPAMAMLAKMMRAGNVSGVYYLMKLREFARNQRTLRTVLKHMGIGKHS